MNPEPDNQYDVEYDASDVWRHSSFYMWEREDEADIVNGKTKAMVTRDLRSLYDSGLPFFTHERLRELQTQLQTAVDLGERVRVTALDGALVEFEIETGRVLPTDRHDLERVLTAPVIHYIPVQSMIPHSEAYPYIPRLAYCNLRIVYAMMTRNKTSKEILAPPEPSSEDVGSAFRNVQDAWNRSQACMRLKTIVESARPRCTKIIGFGLGPIAQGFQESEPQRSAFQHALILSLQDTLVNYQPPAETTICLAQDPAYTEIDKSLLSDCGVTVVNDPEGFVQLDDATAVVSCSPNVPVKQIVSDLACPALVIWDTIKDHESHVLRTDPDSTRVREMFLTKYDRMDFPGEQKYFGSLSVYIRRR